MFFETYIPLVLLETTDLLHLAKGQLGTSLQVTQIIRKRAKATPPVTPATPIAL